MTTVTEIWKEIPGMNGYFASNLGNIKGLRGDIKKPHLNPNGYFTTSIQIDKKPVAHAIHRLIAKTFVANDDIINKCVVNHINRDKNDNRAENLEWVSYKENSVHAANCKAFKNQKGVICINNTTNEIKRFRSITFAGDELGLFPPAILLVLNKKTMQTKGWYFEYDDERETITSGNPNNKKIFNKLLCPVCKNEFDQTTFNRKFCSKKCTDKHYELTAKPNCKCTECGKELYRKPFYIRNYKNIFCSKECNSKYKRSHPLGKNKSKLEILAPMIEKLSLKDKAKMIKMLEQSI